MANISVKYGESALVLGSAEGLGAAFVNEIVRRGFINIYLVDKNEIGLKSIADSINKDSRLNIQTIVIDLSEEQTWWNISKVITENKIGLVIFNAAYGPVGLFKSQSSESIQKIVNLNINCATFVISEVLNKRVDTDPLGLVLLSSLSAYFGGIGIAAYAASKSYLLTLGRSLYRELKTEKIDVITCCPGMIDTPGLNNSHPNLSGLYVKPSRPTQVAKITLDAIGKKAIVIPGRVNRLSYFIFNRLLPNRAVYRLVDNVLDHMYKLRKEIKEK